MAFLVLDGDINIVHKEQKKRKKKRNVEESGRFNQRKKKPDIEEDMSHIQET